MTCDIAECLSSACVTGQRQHLERSRQRRLPSVAEKCDKQDTGRCAVVRQIHRRYRGVCVCRVARQLLLVLLECEKYFIKRFVGPVATDIVDSNRQGESARGVVWCLLSRCVV